MEDTPYVPISNGEVGNPEHEHAEDDSIDWHEAAEELVGHPMPPIGTVEAMIAVAKSVESQTFEAFVDQIMKEAKVILFYKRNLRGTDNITEQGVPGVINRMASDKMARLQNWAELVHLKRLLLKHGYETPPDFEQMNPDIEGDTVHDDLLDVINYAIITLALIAGRWE